MAYTDAQLRPSQAQSLAGAAATTTSTNVIDLLSPNANIGRGRPRRAYSTVTTAFTGGTSVRADLVQSPNADLSGGTVLVTGQTVTTPTLGTKLMDVVIPDNTARYVGFQYTTVGTYAAGAVSSYIVADTDRQPYLPAQTGF